MVYVGAGNHQLFGFNATTGHPLKGFPVTTGSLTSCFDPQSSPAVANGIVYIGSQNKSLYAFNAATGAPISGFPAKTGGYIAATPAVANGVVYIGTFDKKLYAFNAVTGKLRERLAGEHWKRNRGFGGGGQWRGLYRLGFSVRV